MSSVAAYLRVSTSDQDAGWQRHQIAKWCEMQGMPEPEWYADNGVSGRLDSRPAWDRLLAGVEDGSVKTIVVAELSRLGRRAQSLAALFETLQRKGVRLVSIRESIDLGSVYGRMVAVILAAVAQAESENIGERVRAGLERRRAEGKPVGGGYRARGVPGRIPTTEAQDVEAFERFEAGEPIERVRDWLGLKSVGGARAAVRRGASVVGRRVPDRRVDNRPPRREPAAS